MAIPRKQNQLYWMVGILVALTAVLAISVPVAHDKMVDLADESDNRYVETVKMPSASETQPKERVLPQYKPVAPKEFGDATGFGDPMSDGDPIEYTAPENSATPSGSDDSGGWMLGGKASSGSAAAPAAKPPGGDNVQMFKVENPRVVKLTPGE